MSRLRWMRALDAALAGLCLWGAVNSRFSFRSRQEALGLALAILGLGLVIRPVRVRWRPVTGSVCLAVSRSLRPGAHAWYVRPRDADVVLVTARRGVRLVIARPDLVSGEGMSVRRTRVLLLPVEAEDGRRVG
jgi:hypothetical protein